MSQYFVYNQCTPKQSKGVELELIKCWADVETFPSRAHSDLENGFRHNIVILIFIALDTKRTRPLSFVSET